MSAEPATRGQTLAWLSWLAKGMETRRQAVFLLERLDESWLETRWQRLGYLATFGALFGTMAATLMWGFWKLSNDLDPPRFPIAVPLEFWIAATVAWACASIAIDWWRPQWRPSQHRPGGLGVALDLLAAWAGWSLLWLSLWGALILGAAATDRRHWVITQDWLTDWVGLSHPLQAGLVVVLLYVLRYRPDNDARTVEALEWSRWAALAGLVGGAIAGAGFFLLHRLMAYVFGQPPQQLVFYLLLGGTIGSLLRGMRRYLAEKHEPNEGVRLSLRNALYGGGLSAVVLGLAIWGLIAVYVASDAVSATEGALRFAALAGGAGALWFGGLDFVRYWVVRLFLLPGKPRHWIRFLEHAVELRFMDRSGGGYVFIHRFLQEHFALREASWRSPRAAQHWHGPLAEKAADHGPGPDTAPRKEDIMDTRSRDLPEEVDTRGSANKPSGRPGKPDPYVDFIVEVVRDRALAKEFHDHPDAALARTNLSDEEKETLKWRPFREGVVKHILDRGDVIRDVG